VPPEVFRGQPPLTDADVPAVLELQRAARNGAAVSPRKTAEIAARHGTTPERMAFANAKLMSGLILLEPGGLSREELARRTGTPLALPDETELEVARRAAPGLKLAMGN
jgi:hypothetical protein